MHTQWASNAVAELTRLKHIMLREDLQTFDLEGSVGAPFSFDRQF